MTVRSRRFSASTATTSALPPTLSTKISAYSTTRTATSSSVGSRAPALHWDAGCTPEAPRWHPRGTLQALLRAPQRHPRGTPRVARWRPRDTLKAPQRHPSTGPGTGTPGLQCDRLRLGGDPSDEFIVSPPVWQPPGFGVNPMLPGSVP